MRWPRKEGMAHKKKDEQVVMDSKSSMLVLNLDGTTKRVKIEVKIIAFQAVTAFDVNQTQGKDFPQLGVSERIDSVEDYRDMVYEFEKSITGTDSKSGH